MRTILKYKYISILFIGLLFVLMPNKIYAQCTLKDPGNWEGVPVTNGQGPGGNNVDRSCKYGSIDRAGINSGRSAQQVWCSPGAEKALPWDRMYCDSCRGNNLEYCDSMPAQGKIIQEESWVGIHVNKGGRNVERSCKYGSIDRAGPGIHASEVWCSGSEVDVRNNLFYCDACKGLIERPDPNRAPLVTHTGTTYISYNTATTNWEYIDLDGDPQSYYQVQVATDTEFSNIVFSKSGVGNSLNMSIDGLSPGTTYYPRVMARDSKGADSNWSNGPAFTTRLNQPPTVTLNSVDPSASDPDKYTSAVINWTYTDPAPENDPQTSAEIAISTSSIFATNTTVYVSSGAGTSYTTALASLLPGETYYVRVRAENEANGWSGWSNSISVRMPDYPDPEFTFQLTGDGKTVNYSDVDKKLVLKTGDKVNANWSINNGTEVGLQSCALSTTGGTDLYGEQEFRASLVGTGFSGNFNNKQVPTILEDRTYFVKLICPGKQAKTVKSVDQTINLEVQSYPIITNCDVNKNTVKAGQTNVNITAQVENVSSYSWEVKRDINDLSNNTNNISLGNSPIPNPITLNYAGTEFGRYTPWLKVTKSGTDRSDERTCGTVANLGDSNVREINP